MITFILNKYSNTPKINNWLLYLCLLVFSILIVRYQYQLLTYIEWADEAETIVTVRMILSGSKLYSEIHNLHGPLTFLPGILVEQFGSFGIPGHRVPIFLLQWIAFSCIFFSPILKENFARILFSVIFITISLIYLPDIFGHTYTYQVIAGLMLVIVLTQYTLVSIIYPKALSRSRVWWGNILIASLPFLAMTYIPLAICLFFASLRKEHLKNCFGAAVIGTILNLIFLILIGSMIGYMVLHYWVNLKVSPQYLEGPVSAGRFINAFISGSTSDIFRFITFLLMMLSIGRIASHEAGFPRRSLLVFLGIVSLLLRANGFQGLTYLYTSMALAIVFFDISFLNNMRITGGLIMALCVFKLSYLIPAAIVDRQIRSSTEFSELVKKITKKDDRILAWPLQHYEYLLADRLPASGDFFYLPWQMDYYLHPKMNIKIDSCLALEKQ